MIAGPGGDSGYGRQMQELAAVDKDILFPGMVNGPAKWGAFYGCEAFVLPSHQENFGISVVEALACGKPALISNQVNIWREIKDAGAGIISDDNEEGVKVQLSLWVNLSNGERFKMSEKAKAAYNDKFSIEEAAKKMKFVLENQIL